MASPPEPVSPGGLVRLALLQLPLSALFIVAFADGFDYSRRIVWLHLSIVAAAAALAGLGFHAVLRLSSSSAARRFVAGAAAVIAATLWLVYAADAVSNWFWRHNVTYDLAARYLARPTVLAGYVLLVVDWPILAAGAVLFVAAVLYILFSGRVDRGLTYLQAQSAAQSRAVRLGLGGVFLVFLASAVAAVTTTRAGPARRLLLQREPLTGLFIAGERPDRLGLAALAAQYRIEGPLVRSRYPARQDFHRRSVVLIVADSLRPDHLQIQGYARQTTPFLQRLRERGHLRVVRRALATCPESNCGISSIMDSKTFGSLVQENFKLHELLRDQGYDTHFVLSGDHQWLGLKAFYGSDLTTYVDGSASRTYDLTDDRVLFEGLERIPGFTGTPAFFYIHLMSAHVLGVRQEQHLVYQPSRARTSWELYGRDTREMRVNNYDNGVRQADAVIEQLFGALDAKGYLRDALVVITSDHGEGLGERPGADGFGHAGWLYQEFIGIPLLIYEEQQAPYANLELATQIDVAPTIVDRLGLQVPSSWEGHSLLRGGVRAYTHHFTPDPPHQAILHPSSGRIYKLLRQAGREELFELMADPGERRNILASADEALVGDLRTRLDDALPARVRQARDRLSR